MEIMQSAVPLIPSRRNSAVISESERDSFSEDSPSIKNIRRSDREKFPKIDFLTNHCGLASLSASGYVQTRPLAQFSFELLLRRKTSHSPTYTGPECRPCCLPSHQRRSPTTYLFQELVLSFSGVFCVESFYSKPSARKGNFSCPTERVRVWPASHLLAVNLFFVVVGWEVASMRFWVLIHKRHATTTSASKTSDLTDCKSGARVQNMSYGPCYHRPPSRTDPLMSYVSMMCMDVFSGNCHEPT